MLILALDTSGRMASCCLYEDGKKRSSCFKDSQLQHSRTILPICEQMLKEQNVSLDDIDAFAACIGPGSFTGIRIGVAIIKGFALAGGKPAAGVSSLEAAAAAVPENGLICSIIKARTSIIMAFSGATTWAFSGYVPTDAFPVLSLKRCFTVPIGCCAATAFPIFLRVTPVRGSGTQRWSRALKVWLYVPGSWQAAEGLRTPGE